MLFFFFFLLIKVANQVMLIWFPCVVMKTHHEEGSVFNKRMTNWQFGISKSTITTSSTRHWNSSKNFITFSFSTMWISVNFVYDVNCATTFCLLVSSFQVCPKFLSMFPTFLHNVELVDHQCSIWTNTMLGHLYFSTQFVMQDLYHRDQFQCHQQLKTNLLPQAIFPFCNSKWNNCDW